MTYTATLNGKRAAILQRYHHPWVFSKGLQKKPSCGPGELVRVTGPNDAHLGWAFYNGSVSICLRMVSFDEVKPDASFWRQRLQRALTLRRNLLGDARNFRLINGEHDGFPGLTADVYGDLICVQVASAGMDRIKTQLAEAMAQVVGAKAVYERSDTPARNQEGLKPANGFLHGAMAFPMTITERGFRYQIDPVEGHKTGFYLDQREQHAWIEARAQGKSVLDLCCYVGGFTMAALRGGAAQVRAVDASGKALAAANRHIADNELSGDYETVQSDVFQYLRNEPDQRFDMVILDPPALARSVKNSKPALKAYSRLQTSVAKWVKPGGLLLTFSCSGVVTPAEFQQSVFLGLREAEREPLVIHRCGPSADHPVNLHFPEGEYLKGLALHLP